MTTAQIFRAVFLGVGISIGGVAQAITVTNGTLSTHNNDVIFDFDIARWMNQYFEDGSKGDKNVTSDVLIIHTACYGGNFIENFNSTTGDTYYDPALQKTTGDADYDTISFTNATILTAQEAGDVAYYNGYDNDAGDALVPGATANSVHTAGILGKNQKERPSHGGSLSKAVGGSSSTHLLIYTGKPNGIDKKQLESIHSSWDGRPNTTVKVLWGDGSEPLADGAATRAQFQAAMQSIGPMITAGEQFILYIGDHGGQYQAEKEPKTATSTPGSNTNTAQVEVSNAAVHQMQADPNSQPYAQFVTQQTLSTTQEMNIGVDFFGATFLGYLSDADWTTTVDLPNGGTGTGYNYYFDEAILTDPSVVPAGPSSVQFNMGFSNFTQFAGDPVDVTMDRVAIYSGNLAKPQPGDLDWDGDIDGVDLGEFFTSFTGPNIGPPANAFADIDNDNDVDGVDLGEAFSLFTGPQAPANVPEPTAIALLGLAGLIVARRPRG